MEYYEYKQISEKIDRWQRSSFKTGVIPKLLNAFFLPFEKIVDIAISDETIQKASKPINKILKNLHNSSMNFVNVESIICKAFDAGLDVDSLDKLRSKPIEYLDVLAKSFFDRNAQYAAVQGAGLGAAGHVFVAVDIPLLFFSVLKTIFQIGACYGYNYNTIEDKEFVLRIFCIATAISSERSEEFQKIDDLISSIIDGTFLEESSILATDKGVNAFINKLIRWFIRKIATRSFPAVGIALGSSFNYIFTKEVSVYAYMLYRKRFIRDRLFANRLY